MEEALISVINQTYEDWIVLIGINGHGETGGEVAIKANEISKLDKKGRIIIIVQNSSIDNKPKCLNDLVEKHVKSEWVAILDADDVWLSNKLVSQIEVLNKECMDCEVIGTGCDYFGEDKDKNKWQREGPREPGLIPFKTTLSHNPIINSSVMFKSKYAHWKDVFAIEDYDLWLALDYKMVKMFNVRASLVKHR